MGTALAALTVSLKNAVSPDCFAPKGLRACEGRDTWNRIDTLSVILLLGVAAAVRLYHIGAESLDPDEIAGWFYLSTGTLSQFAVEKVRSDTPSGFVYFTLAYLCTHLTASIVATRVLSILLGVATVGAMYGLGRRLFGSTAGFVAALLTAMSNMHIFYTQEIRMYAAVLLLAVLSVYTFCRLLDATGWKWLGLHLIVNVLLMEAHLIAALLPFVEGCFLLVCRRRDRALWLVWGLVHGVAGAGFVAAVLTSGFKVPWIPVPALDILVRCISWDSAYLPRFLPHYPIFRWLFLIPIVTLIVAAICASARKTPANHLWRNLLFLLSWLLVPPVVMFVESHLFPPHFVPRYLLHGSLALFLIVGGAVSVLPRSFLRGTAVAIITVFMVCHTMSDGRPFRPDWNRCFAGINEMKGPGDHVFMTPGALGVLSHYTSVHHVEIDGVEDVPALMPRVIREASQGRNVLVGVLCSSRGGELGNFEEMVRNAHLACEQRNLSGGNATYYDSNSWAGWLAYSGNPVSIILYRVMAQNGA